MTASEHNASDVKETNFAIYLHFAAPLDIASAAAQPGTGSAGPVSMPATVASPAGLAALP